MRAVLRSPVKTALVGGENDGKNGGRSGSYLQLTLHLMGEIGDEAQAERAASPRLEVLRQARAGIAYAKSQLRPTIEGLQLNADFAGLLAAKAVLEAVRNEFVREQATRNRLVHANLNRDKVQIEANGIG